MSTLTLAICARNAHAIIGECLESIRAQSVPPDRILVAVDDLDDPTVAVAKELGADIIASNANGLYQARNAVLAACTTDYLAFTDADCVLVPDWVERVKGVLDTKPEVGGGTGRHPARGRRNFAAWLHHMWYVVETEETGETTGLIGGNSYFRTEALRRVGGWLRLPGHSAAEDVYIAGALREAGYTLWFEAGAAAHHDYERSLRGLCRKSVMMGEDIVVMMRACGRRDWMWTYTWVIPVLAGAALAGLGASLLGKAWGLALLGIVLAVSFSYLAARFRSVRKAFPRWIARWILIWPYTYGILKGAWATVPDQVDAEPQREAL